MGSEKRRYYPEVGTPLYLQSRCGDSWVDRVKTPYTVIQVTKRNIFIQSCNLVFKGDRYYDTLPDEILPDSEGEILRLSWAPSKGVWQIDKYHTGYPEYAYFGKYEYAPYLN